jgi:hypothetical protein
MFASSDSSWNDDVDHGQSTGCFLIFYMGGIVDNSSNMPDPVALPSNEACLACMATNHLCMRLKDLEGKQSSSPKELYLDNQSAIAIGKSFKDTKNTRHILRRYHYIRESIDTGRITPVYIGIQHQVADFDFGTKPLAALFISICCNTP